MSHELHMENIQRVNRRQLFGRSACGIGAAALSSLLNPSSATAWLDDSKKSQSAGLPGLPHHAAKAKRVIVFWQGGGPSHVDLFDEKPVMAKMHSARFRAKPHTEIN